jgi:aminoglycoside phosphotransferase (APT) family kinase protein
LLDTIGSKIIEIREINTGWTNIVFDVQTEQGNYIARFPRSLCFSNAIISDVNAINFLKQRIDIKTIDIALYYDRSRPFSIHKKISGYVLTEKMPFLTNDDVSSLASEIADFFVKMHSIKFADVPINLKRKLSVFLKEVMDVVDSYDDYSEIDALAAEENPSTMVAVHGDLNIGNIIVNEEKKIEAFIDFAFFGVSTVEIDLARIACRINDDFFRKIIFFYEQKSGKTIEHTVLNRQKQLWVNIEDHYIAYMKKNLPYVAC